MNVVTDMLFIITAIIIIGVVVLSVKRLVEILIARHYEKQYKITRENCKKIKEEIEEKNNERIYKS